VNELTRIHANEDGAKAIDRGLIVDLVALALVAAVTLVGSHVSEMFHNIAASIR
jgi:Flp pilus assembly pilin Flp